MSVSGMLDENILRNVLQFEICNHLLDNFFLYFCNDVIYTRNSLRYSVFAPVEKKKENVSEYLIL